MWTNLHDDVGIGLCYTHAHAAPRLSSLLCGHLLCPQPLLGLFSLRGNNSVSTQARSTPGHSASTPESTEACVRVCVCACCGAGGRGCFAFMWLNLGHALGTASFFHGHTHMACMAVQLASSMRCMLCCQCLCADWRPTAAISIISYAFSSANSVFGHASA